MGDDSPAGPFDEHGQPPDYISAVILLHDMGHHHIDGPHPFVLAYGRWEVEIEVETDTSNHSAFGAFSAERVAEDRVGDHAVAIADGYSVAWGEILAVDYFEDEQVLRMKMNAAGVPSTKELEKMDDVYQMSPSEASQME